MDELLAGYLLEALEPQQHQAVATRLQAEPELQARLEAMRRALEPLALDAEAPEPPRSLVTATLAHIAEHRCRSLPQAPMVTPSQRGGGQWRGFRRPDILVAAGMLVLLGSMLLVGVVRVWRDHAHRAACANNLREMWGGLERYADEHHGRYPEVEEKGSHSVAGIFVPVLSASGALTSRPPVTCPGEGKGPYQAPPTLAVLDELHDKQPEAFRAAAANLAGNYAYSMGYVQDNGHLRGLDRNADGHLPILADRLPASADGNSPNHDGTGQNVLYLGGNVAWCTLRTVGVNRDDIYLNRRSEVRAGVCLEDTVLGASDASPMPSEP